MVTNISIFIWRWLLPVSYVSCERKEQVDIYRNKGTEIGEKLARNYVLVKFLLFIVDFRFWLPFFPFSSAYFRKVSQNGAMFLIQAPPFPPTAPLSSSDSMSAVLRPGIQVLGRAPDGAGGKDY